MDLLAVDGIRPYREPTTSMGPTHMTSVVADILSVTGDATVQQELFVTTNVHVTGPVYGRIRPQHLAVGAAAVAVSGLTTGSACYVFSGSADSHLYYNIDMPDDWEQGTPLTVYASYISQTANAGDVKWVLTHSVGVIPAYLDMVGSTLPTVTTANSAVVSYLQHVQVGVIPMTGMIGRDVLVTGRLSRLGASDSYAGASYLYYISVYYQKSRWGRVTL